MLHNGNDFFNNIAKMTEQARVYVGRTAGLVMCAIYFDVGRMIIKEEQGGKARAAYGKGLRKELSIYLNNRAGKGFSVTTLKNARKFYRTYSSTMQQTIFSELESGSDAQKGQTVFAQFHPLALEDGRTCL